ncbi:MAG: multifunctional CCA addition/repair protein [Cycloclasticus sp.]|jgi:tRNA nucleotidyltransferase (CCA-adding enzyme)|nr:multifunctional CCA addition/repair protein [Cycloclasticus sp.]MDF1688524.1 multifunctional CCA addition/repair protein [Cycloclasticus sp.]MEE4291480.1 multifunctional CCA addition/repair protein [Cycloclasticus sp.]
MNIYLVGGAVRDKLLNYPSKDKDYVVVGSTVEEMLQHGFEQVGKDFPVFLHPDTKAEYALARTERKSGSGYAGFEVYAAPDVSLVEDLQRRDLTINAMAMNEQGLVDPYGGQADLKAKVLRHVSENFKEDPLRVLRLARFAARYAHMGFTVADSTMEFMREMVGSGELSTLMAERVWQEIQRSLGERSPEVFFEVLRQCGALAVILPEIEALFGVPQPAKHHPEIDTGLHTMMVLQQAVLLSNSPVVRFAALTHDLGKGLTSAENWPSHYGHETKGLRALRALVARLRVPNEYVGLAEKVMEYHTHCHRALELKAATLLKMLEAVGAFRQADKLDQFLLACEADSRGRLGFENRAYPQAQWVKKAFLAVNQVSPKEFVEQGLVGKEIGNAIYKRRLEVLKKIKA